MTEVDIQLWPGYAGCFSRQHAKGAIPNGVRVLSKIGHAGGIVLGSVNARSVNRALCEQKNIKYGYWIEWDDWPKCAFFVLDTKIKVGAHAIAEEAAQ